MNNNSKDIHLKISLTLEEMFVGVQKSVHYQRKISCPSCKGKSKKCKECKGSSLKTVDAIEEISIPAGVDRGMTINKLKKGHHVPRNFWSFLSKKNAAGGSKPGDLIVDIEQIKHPVFQRDQDHLIFIFETTKAAIDEKAKVISIPLLDGKMVKFEIPQHISNDKVLRIQGKGFKNLKSGAIGHLLIHVKIIDINI